MRQEPDGLSQILVVSNDTGVQEQLGAALEDRGLRVIACPGPCASGPCVGLTRNACPLREAADAVVLDIHPDGCDYRDQSGRAGLVAFYRAGGKPVVMLIDEEDVTPDAPLAGTQSLSRMAPAEVVGEVVEALNTGKRRPG